MESQDLRVLTFTSLAHFVNDGTSLLFPLLIVYYSVVAHVSVVFLGALSVLYNLLSGLLSPVIGNFADKRDLDAELLGLGLTLEGVAFALFTLSFLERVEVYPLVTLGAAILGSGQSFYHPIGGAILSRTFGRTSGRALGINGSLGSIGRALMPSLVTALTVGLGESLGLGAFAGYMLVVSLLVWRGMSTYRKGRESTRKGRERLERKYYGFLLLLGSLVFIRNMSITGVTTFSGQFIYDVYLSKTLPGIFLTLSFLGSIVGQPVFGWITERAGGKIAFQMSSAISVISFGLFLLYYRDFVLSTLLYSIFTFSAFTAFPVLMGYVSQKFPRNFYTAANSYIWGIGVTVGGAAGSAAVTSMLSMGYTLFSSFVVMLILAVISLVLTMLLK